MTDRTSLQDRIILISGATGGIGLATAEMCLQRGARVVLCGRSLAKVDKIVTSYPETAVAMELDVDDPQSVAGLPDQLPAAFRDVDTLICNAGHDRGGRRPFLQANSRFPSFPLRVVRAPDSLRDQPVR